MALKGLPPGGGTLPDSDAGCSAGMPGATRAVDGESVPAPDLLEHFCSFRRSFCHRAGVLPGRVRCRWVPRVIPGRYPCYFPEKLSFELVFVPKKVYLKTDQ